MKKLLVFILAASLFTACNNDKGKDRYDRDRDKERTKDDYRDADDDKKTTDDRDKDKTADDDSKTTTGWTSSDENRFMNDCEGTAVKNVGAARANEYCDCMLQKIKKMYNSYTEADRELAGSSEEAINRLADECNGR
jgi:Ni/Co efflux regulator RcnB